MVGGVGSAKGGLDDSVGVNPLTGGVAAVGGVDEVGDVGGPEREGSCFVVAHCCGCVCSLERENVFIDVSVSGCLGCRD